MTCSAVDRTWVSEVPLAMTKKSVASETPVRSRRTTSVALRSRARAAARWAVASEEVVVDWAIRGPFRNLMNALRRPFYRPRQEVVPCGAHWLCQCPRCQGIEGSRDQGRLASTVIQDTRPRSPGPRSL